MSKVSFLRYSIKSEKKEKDNNNNNINKYKTFLISFSKSILELIKNIDDDIFGEESSKKSDLIDAINETIKFPSTLIIKKIFPIYQKFIGNKNINDYNDEEVNTLLKDYSEKNIRIYIINFINN